MPLPLQRIIPGLLCILLPHGLLGQFTDDFSDGDFTANPMWDGDTAKFEVDGLNQLHLDAVPVTDVAYLSTPSTAINNATWEFFVRMDFNPSSSNQALVYLVSDQADLNGPLNGYLVRIGGTEDEISLFRQDGSTQVEIIDGTDDKVNVSQVNVRVQVTRDALGNWEVLSDTAGGNNFVSEGTATDNTYQQSFFFGVFCDYTSTRSDKFFFDDFDVSGQPFMDVIPPQWNAVTVVSNTELDLSFSEPLDPGTAGSTNNYSVNNGIGTPATAVLDGSDPSLVHLTFSNPFPNGQTNSLTVQNVEDLSGNAMAITSLDFTFFNPGNPGFKSVVINEIFPDPSPPASLPEVEFVELHNTASDIFDLSGLTFSDGSSTATLPFFALQPGGFVILCPAADTADFSSFGDVLGLSPWPTLNNTGDNLVLTDDSGTVIDAVSYDDSWYQDEFKDDGGFSLELINPQAQCNTGAANWIATNDLTGGTPGAQNSVLDVSPDVTAPEILEVTITAGNALRITFSEGMDSLSLANASYTINPGLNVVTVAPELPQLTAVDLTLGTVIDPAQLYTITITGATDCSGNSLAPVALPFGTGVVPQPSDLVINEVFADPDEEIGSLPNAEFVELYNPTNKLLRLDGLTFSDATSTTALPAAVALPGDHLIICDDGFEDLYAPLGKTLPVVTMPSLNNSSDQLSLNDAQGTEIDRVNYNDSWYADNNKDDGGYTLERINPLDPCGGMNNWLASNDPSGGTPGRANSVLDSNAAIPLPAVLAVSVVSLSQIEVTFNRQMDSLALANGSYTFAVAIGVVLAEAVLPDLTTVRLTLDAALTPGQAYDLTVDNVFDCAGNGLTSETVRFYLARPLDLVINEVLFNPRGSGSDFVELFNRSPEPINLQRWALARLDDQDSLIRSPINTPLTLLPGEFALLNEDGENILLEYPNAREERFVDMDLPSYNNDEGSVILVNGLDSVIDRFDYSEDYHFALLQELDGVSLERISAQGRSNDPTNWHSAAEQAGFATPGFENSQATELLQAPNDPVSVLPEVFSPNNDGMDDVVNITYQFLQPGRVANVVIYDPNGRTIRNLVRNELLGTSGTFTWDGITDENEKARIGIYVIVFEVFEANGNTEQFKRTCVVASRL